MCALRRGDAALHGPGPHGRGARRGGGASGRVQLLPETLSLRGEPAAVRASGGGLGADARRAETQARRPSHSSAVTPRESFAFARIWVRRFAGSARAQPAHSYEGVGWRLFPSRGRWRLRVPARVSSPARKAAARALRAGLGVCACSPLFTWPAGGADDHVEPTRAGAAGKRFRRDAQLLREAHGDAFALRREVHRRLRVREGVRAADLLDSVAEGADPARDLSRVVDVTATVQHGHVDPPGRRQDRHRSALALVAGRAGDEEKRAEHRQHNRDGADDRKSRQRIAFHGQWWDRKACELARLAVVHPEPARIEHGRDERVVRPREAVDATLLEPAHLLRGEPRPPCRLLHRQLSVQACTRKRRLLARGFERFDELHARSHSAPCGGHLYGRSSAKSPSPGGLRSSQGTSSAGSARNPASGTASQAPRASSRGWSRTPPYVAATRSAPPRRQVATWRSLASNASSAPSPRTTTAASTSSPNAARPQRNDAPGPRSQSAQ